MCLCVAGVPLFLAPPVCASQHLPPTVFCKRSFYLIWWNLNDFFWGTFLGPGTWPPFPRIEAQEALDVLLMPVWVWVEHACVGRGRGPASGHISARPLQGHVHAVSYVYRTHSVRVSICKGSLQFHTCLLKRLRKARKGQCYGLVDSHRGWRLHHTNPFVHWAQLLHWSPRKVSEPSPSPTAMCTRIISGKVGKCGDLVNMQSLAQ